MDELFTYLKIDDFPGVGCARHVLDWWNMHFVLVDLCFDVPQLTFHLIAPTHLVDELALERIYVRV